MNAKEIKIGEWYYRMMGYGGGDSRYCCIRRRTGEKTESGMMSLFNGTGRMQPIPVSEIYEAVDELGRVHRVSANDLAANGHIGIGTLEGPRNVRAFIYREDAARLLASGRYTMEQIKAEFPLAFSTDEAEFEADANSDMAVPMTDGQEAILRAANEERNAEEKRRQEAENRKFAEAVAAARRRFNYIPCPKQDGKYLRTGEVSRNLRAVLKHEFPGVKFSVRSNSFSGGDDARVSWVDGPSRAKVEPLVDGFGESVHEPNTDYWDHVTTVISAVCGGFSYTFAEREYSDAARKPVEDFFRAKGYKGNDLYREVHAVLDKTDFPAAFEIEAVVFNADKAAFEIKFKAAEKPVTPPPDNGGKGDGVTVTANEEKGGIEIRFPAMPSEKIRNLCKGAGFRWSKFSKCWWSKMCDRSVAAAEQIVAEWNAEHGQAAA